VDTGPIVAQAAVPVLDGDTVESLHERIKVEERQMLVDAVGRIAREGFTIDGRVVRFGGGPDASDRPVEATRYCVPTPLARVGHPQGVTSPSIDRLGARPPTTQQECVP